MNQIPDVNVADLQKLDERMLKEAQKGTKVDKARKEMFKKVTTPVSITLIIKHFLIYYI